MTSHEKMHPSEGDPNALTPEQLNSLHNRLMNTSQVQRTTLHDIFDAYKDLPDDEMPCTD